MLAGAFFSYYFFGDQDESTESGVEQSQNNQQPDEAEVAQEPEVESLPDQQANLDSVIPSLRGTHSVQLIDTETGTILAEYQETESFFAASIYKLYVAYLGLIDIENGDYEASEVYNQGRTRQQCIVEMVRDSDSPCAEQMWVEQGREVSTERLQGFGFANTSMTALTTTVEDANRLLLRLQQKDDLNATSEELLRSALKEQIYRQAVPAAVPEAVVYNKVGFYETGWLDSAIVLLPNGREVILSIFVDSAGSREVAAITEAILSELVAL